LVIFSEIGVGALEATEERYEGENPIEEKPPFLRVDRGNRL
jgi:hypothetical protein